MGRERGRMLRDSYPILGASVLAMAASLWDHSALQVILPLPGSVNAVFLPWFLPAEDDNSHPTFASESLASLICPPKPGHTSKAAHPQCLFTRPSRVNSPTRTLPTELVIRGPHLKRAVPNPFRTQEVHSGEFGKLLVSSGHVRAGYRLKRNEGR